MARLELHSTPLAGLLVVQRTAAEDTRGSFSRVFCSDALGAAGWEAPVAQINHSVTRRQGAVRGLHFQHPPHAETKLVSCLRGEVWDVAVDLRRGSPTFLQWHAERLSADNRRSLLIPRGFAHGFQCLREDCELLYLHSAAYHPDAEGALRPTDPRLAIGWPLPIAEMSERDRQHPLLGTDFEGVFP